MLGITFAGETKDSERILSGSLVVSGVDKEACKHIRFYPDPWLTLTVALAHLG